jgi:hypothetical protein
MSDLAADQSDDDDDGDDFSIVIICSIRFRTYNELFLCVCVWESTVAGLAVDWDFNERILSFSLRDVFIYLWDSSRWEGLSLDRGNGFWVCWSRGVAHREMGCGGAWCGFCWNGRHFRLNNLPFAGQTREMITIVGESLLKTSYH